MLGKLLLIMFIYLSGCVFGYYYKYFSNPMYRNFAWITLLMPVIYFFTLLIAPIHYMLRENTGILEGIKLFTFVLFRYGELNHIVIVGTRTDYKSAEKVVAHKKNPLKKKAKRLNKAILVFKQLKDIILKDKIVEMAPVT